MKANICQILSLTGLATTGLLAAASLLQLIRFDLPLAYAIFTFAAAIEICRNQYEGAGSPKSLMLRKPTPAPEPKDATAKTSINLPVAA